MVEAVRTGVSYEDILKAEAKTDKEIQIEVVGGRIIKVEQRMTFMHMLIIQNLYHMLRAFVRSQTLGTVWFDGVRYVILGQPDNIRIARRPDLSFLRAGRIPDDFDWHGDFYGAPDFAVEVQSPGQTQASQLARVVDFLQNGTEEAWIIYPTRNEVFQYRTDASAPQVYSKDQQIVTPLFAGFQVTLADLLDKDAL
jgi:Uma2 family endonuclease